MSARKKRRPCPAIGSEITSAQCGSERNTRHVCPADCVFNPLSPANYGDLLEIEHKLDDACMKRLIEADAEVDQPFWIAYRDDRLNPSRLHNGVVRKLYLDRDADDRSFVERWEAAGYEGLKNDAVSVLRFKRRVRMGLLEIQCLPGPGRVQIVDLLRPDETAFEVRDNSLHRQALRFQVLLCWYYELPHYRRICGNGTIFPTWGQMEPTDALRSISRHHGGPADLAGLAEWLAANANTVEDTLFAVGTARQQQMLESIDATFGKAVYELNQPFGTCRNWLEENPQVDFDDLSDEELDEGFAQAHVWFEEDEEGQSAIGRPVCGRILLGQSNWRVEAMGEERFGRLRERFEAHMGDRVRFTGERLDDLATRIAQNQAGYDASLVPPELLEEPDKIALQSGRSVEVAGEEDATRLTSQYRSDHLRRLPDTSIPALDDKTPRAASADPELRPRLIRWAKNMVSNHDKQNLQAGTNEDINWLLEELGLDEIDFPAPPLRVAEPQFAESEDRLHLPATNLPPNVNPAPRLPADPIDFEEAEKRIGNGLDAFPTAAAAFEELDRQGSPIINDLYVLTDGLIGDDDFNRSIAHIFQAWFSLVPPGCLAPALDRDYLGGLIDQYLRDFEDALRTSTPGKIQQLLDNHPQPSLASRICVGFLDSQRSGPPEAKLHVSAMPVAQAMLAALLEALDDALRG